MVIMNSIHSEFIQPQKLYNEFIAESDKFETRYEAILTDINHFIEKRGIQNEVKVNETILGFALVDYFEDVMRLKSFHKVKKINAVKVVAYTSYWLLKRKPIQINEQKKELIYINEQFVLMYIIDFLGNDKEKGLFDYDKKGLTSFEETLFYNLKFRNLTATTLEMIILSFLAGRVYQEDNIDISDDIGKYE